MPFPKKLKSAAFLGLVAVALPGLGMADTTWTWKFGSSDGNCESGCSGYSHKKTFNLGSATSPDVEASGWANTGSDNGNRTLQAANLARYRGGLGITHGNDGHHGVDNIGTHELVLFDFGSKSVSLTQLSLGYIWYDADISVLAYTGGGTPTLTDVIYSSDSEGLTGTGGWEVVGNYDVDGRYQNDFYGTSGNYTQTIDSGNTKSSYWIVAAYNKQFGNDCDPTGFCKDGKDYFKVRTLTAKHHKKPPPTNEVPVPGTFLLSALGIALLASRRLQRV